MTRYIIRRLAAASYIAAVRRELLHLCLILRNLK